LQRGPLDRLQKPCRTVRYLLCDVGVRSFHVAVVPASVFPAARQGPELTYPITFPSSSISVTKPSWKD
jgi:hypothetical protein